MATVESAKPGEIVTFRGCCWDAGWEFGAPLVIYEGVKRYCDSNGNADF